MRQEGISNLLCQSQLRGLKEFRFVSRCNEVCGYWPHRYRSWWCLTAVKRAGSRVRRARCAGTTGGSTSALHLGVVFRLRGIDDPIRKPRDRHCVRRKSSKLSMQRFPQSSLADSERLLSSNRLTEEVGNLSDHPPSSCGISWVGVAKTEAGRLGRGGGTNGCKGNRESLLGGRSRLELY